jgi:hypothetical protein
MIYEPAFPDPKRAGMSLRDYFAAQALTALIAGRSIDDAQHLTALVTQAYRFADAMMEVRRQKPANLRGPDEDRRLQGAIHNEGTSDVHGRRAPAARSGSPTRHPPARIYPTDDRDDLHEKHLPFPGASRSSFGTDSALGD